MTTLSALDILSITNPLRLEAERKSLEAEPEPLEHSAAVAFENGVLKTVNTILGALREKQGAKHA